MAYAFKTPLLGAGLGLPVATRDPLIDGDNGGVRALYDFAFPYSYPGGAKPRAAAGAPTNGQSVVDVSGRGNGSVVVGSGQTVAYNGGGLDFSSVTALGNYMQGSGNFATDIASAVSGAPSAYTGLVQRFLVLAYMRLPADGDWNSHASNLAIMLQWATAAYNSTADILCIAQTSNSTKQLAFRRQTAVGSYDTNVPSLPVASADRGIMGQLAFWRSATEQRARLRTVNGTTITASVAVGADNSASFSGLSVKAGVQAQLWPSPISGAGGAKNFRLYRLALENLARSGRDPAAVADEDWTRVQARIAASAAANGGTSLIFV